LEGKSKEVLEKESTIRLIASPNAPLGGPSLPLRHHQFVVA